MTLEVLHLVRNPPPHLGKLRGLPFELRLISDEACGDEA